MGHSNSDCHKVALSPGAYAGFLKGEGEESAPAPRKIRRAKRVAVGYQYRLANLTNFEKVKTVNTTLGLVIVLKNVSSYYDNCWVSV